MMAFWQVPRTELDDATVHLQLTLFHHLVNHGLPEFIDSVAGPSQALLQASASAHLR